MVTNSTIAKPDFAMNDLGPLAWVLDEIRKSLNSATKALKRFAWDAEAARGSDLAAIDASQLRIARQQLHQAVGALEMVGLAGPVLMLRAMEAAVQKFVQQPEHCSQDAVGKIEYASFALTEYLEGVLADKPVSAVSLFPQYRDVLELVRAERIHPADLWPLEWRWSEPQLSVRAPAREYSSDVRAAMDQLVLQVMRGKAPQAASTLRGLSLGFSAHQTDRRLKIFWIIAAGYFEAIAHDLLTADLYVRRMASRVLMQYASLAKGDTAVSERLAHDLLFFCAQSAASQASDTPILSAVRTAYGLSRFKPVNYELVQFGRFDPALLAQARKRIVSAKEAWSSLCAGDATKAKTVSDQFGLVTDSLLKLHPPSEPFAQVLTRTIDTTVRSGQMPGIELAMEVATSVLYLEAVFEDLDPSDPQLAVRTASLAQRLEGVRAGGMPQPLESWMEELYSRVSDKQTMGSVVGELRVSLEELEKLLDAFFRNPLDKSILQTVPGQLSQMRGVLSVLGLDQACKAVLRMKNSVQHMLDTEMAPEVARAAGTFDNLGNNVGALSFLIDMLNYQPALAKKLFVYDEAKGELKPVMGRAHSAAETVEMVSEPVLAPVSEPPPLQVAAPAAPVEIPKPPAAIVPVEAPKPPAPTVTYGDLDLMMDFAIPSTAEPLVLASEPPSQAAAPAVVPVPTQAVEIIDLEEVLQMEMSPVFAIAEQAMPAAKVLDVASTSIFDKRTEAPAIALTAISVSVMQAPAPAPVLPPPVSMDSEDDDDFDLKSIFLEEASEVIGNATQAINELMHDPSDVEHLTVLRRAFHTLKGSARMVGLNEFGEAGWALEQMLNSWLADQKPASKEFRTLCSEVIAAFQSWVTAIAANQDDSWSAVPFRNSAEAMRIEGRYSALQLSKPATGASDATPAAQATLQAHEQPAVSAPAEVVQIQAQTLVSADIELPYVAEIEAAEEAAPDTEFDFLFDAELEQVAEPAQSAEVPAVAAEVMALADTSVTELTDIELEGFFAFSMAEEAVPAAAVPVAPEPVSVEAIELSEEDFVQQFLAADEIFEAIEPAVESAPVAPAVVLPLNDAPEENVTRIGDLRIGTALYNVYVGEADQWSSRLVKEVTEWSREGDQVVSASTVALAHSLAGSSATVGFHALSEMARALEHALQNSRDHHNYGLVYSQVFIDASEDIRRLLHQFAAGFLRHPQADILERLNHLEFPDSGATGAADKDDLYSIFADSEWALEDLDPAPVPVPVPVPVPALSKVLDHHHGVDEDIDAVDAIDPDLFPIFEEECLELMPRLSGALRQWAEQPDLHSARLEVLRVLHTLKGSARLAGALRLGEMAHRIESEIDFVGSDAAHTQEFEPLLTRLDGIQATFDTLRRMDATGAQEPISIAQAAPPQVTELHLEPQDAPQASGASEVSGTTGLASKPAIPAPQAMLMQPVRQAATASIRVRSQLLDRMVNQAGEVMITRSRLEAEVAQLRDSLNDMSGNLTRLRLQLRDIELQAETQMQSRLALAKEAKAGFDPLEFDRFTRVQELTRMMAESVNDVATVQRTLQRTIEATEDDLIAQARQTRELQRDLLRTRMVEFEGISERLYRVVRQISKETGKQVRLDLLGGTLEMDRGMLERMVPAFEHLLRNCVTHGIESPEARAAAGKDAVGLISIHVRQDGNDVSINFSDDGAGLNLVRIRQLAIQRGLIRADQALDESAAANLIFLPGFSTAAQVTELAGRGIGMEVVRSEVNALGGRIETSTVTGKGSHFKLVLPLTTAVTQVVMIRADKLSVGIPANVVETVRRISIKELQQAYNSGTLDVAGEPVPFFWAGALLQASRHSSETQSKNTPVVIFRSAAQRIALHVDEVLGNREVVVKNLGPQLSRLPGMAGMSVLPSGAVVLIYNPVALAAVYGHQARSWSADRAEPHMLGGDATGSAVRMPGMMPVAPKIPLILVVDDSITVRRVTQRMLLRDGYRVALAADGLQALDRLRDELPAVVLSDIEMPRMDGFDLARNIRGDERLKRLPIIMITSRIAGKHHEHAKELGVNHYLGKPYSEDELMKLVRHYCSAEAAVVPI